MTDRSRRSMAPADGADFESQLERIEEQLWSMEWSRKVRLFRTIFRYVGKEVALDFARKGEDADRISHLSGLISSWNHDGREVNLFVHDDEDLIQGHHARGRFYELEELRLIASRLGACRTFLDIGSNVGNHSVYMGMFTPIQRIICIEPNPDAYRILRQNIRLNDLSGTVCLDHLGLGLSDRPSLASAAATPGNLGATRLQPAAEEGTLKLVAGDALFEDETIDFIKIDVEGMEMQVIGGLKTVIQRNRPQMFVEVDDANLGSFEAWMRTHGYRALEVVRPCDHNQNFLVSPHGGAA